jgi:hypothetical protein
VKSVRVCDRNQFSAGPWQFSHETPAFKSTSFARRSALTVAIGAWHTVQRASVTGDVIFSTSAIRADRAVVSVAYDFE